MAYSEPTRVGSRSEAIKMLQADGMYLGHTRCSSAGFLPIYNKHDHKSRGHVMTNKSQQNLGRELLVVVWGK